MLTSDSCTMVVTECVTYFTDLFWFLWSLPLAGGILLCSRHGFLPWCLANGSSCSVGAQSAGAA